MKRKTARVVHLKGEPPEYLVQRCKAYLEQVIVPEAFSTHGSLTRAIAVHLAKQLQIIEELSWK